MWISFDPSEQIAEGIHPIKRTWSVKDTMTETTEIDAGHLVFEGRGHPKRHGVQIIDGVPVVVAVQIKKDIKILKAETFDAIDNLAEGVSSNFATPGSAKAMRYQEKAREAREIVAKLDAGEIVDPALYPACNTEWPARAASFEDFARVVLARANEWAAISGQIEKVQAEGKAAIEAATTREEIETSRNTALAALTAIIPDGP